MKLTIFKIMKMQPAVRLSQRLNGRKTGYSLMMN
jgi:hypothetical protein